MTEHKSNFPEFYITAPQPCPYLPGRLERKLFTLAHGGRRVDARIAARVGVRTSARVAAHAALLNARGA